MRSTIVSFLFSKKKIKIYILIGIILSSFFRLYHLGNPPKGMSGEEVSSAYEAFSIMKTGKDRWGITYPAYFIGWGSGQNTLYSYFSIPFISYFGLNELGARVLSAFLGILTLVFVYLLLAKVLKSSGWALAGTLIYAFNPWHFILSRWSFEENPVPFFAIWGMYMLFIVKEILEKPSKLDLKQKLIVATSLLPFAIMLYAYAMSLFMLPLFFIIYIYFNFSFLKQNFTKLFSSIVVFFITALPFFLFILKNNIIKRDIFIEKYLPFSIPQMLFARDNLVKPLSEKRRELFETARFFFKGFSDRNMYNATDLDTPHLLLAFSFIGFIYLIVKSKKQTNYTFSILLSWTIASFLLFFLFFMNLNRSIHLQTIIPILIIFGIFYVYRISNEVFRLNFKIALVVYFIVTTGIFIAEYFVRFPTTHTEYFVSDYDDALKNAESLRLENEKIAVTPTLLQNYLFTLFYTKFPPNEFQHSNWKHANNRPYVYQFGHYYMLGTIEYYALDIYENNIELLKKEPSAIYITQTSETPLNGNYKLLYSNSKWNVYRCSNTSQFNWNWKPY